MEELFWNCRWLYEWSWFDNIQQEKKLLEYGTKRLLEIEGLKIFGTAKKKLQFRLTLKVFIPTILTIIDKLGIAVRTGHHCITHYEFL
jgi:cysteine desulfurase/selenocysteine lyase